MKIPSGWFVPDVPPGSECCGERFILTPSLYGAVSDMGYKCPNYVGPRWAATVCDETPSTRFETKKEAQEWVELQLIKRSNLRQKPSF
jgi:hypothetical protein